MIKIVSEITGITLWSHLWLKQRCGWSASVIVIRMLIDVQTDTHYAVLSLLLLLANSPTQAEYQQPTTSTFSGVVIV